MRIYPIECVKAHALKIRLYKMKHPKRNIYNHLIHPKYRLVK